MECGGLCPPAVGDWPVTIPGAVPGAATYVSLASSAIRCRCATAALELAPFSDGTSTGRGPLLSSTWIVESCLTRVPTPGVCPTTVPTRARANCVSKSARRCR